MRLWKQWEAILNFLDSSGPDAPPTLREAQQVPEAGQRVQCQCLSSRGKGCEMRRVLAINLVSARFGSKFWLPPFQNNERERRRPADGDSGSRNVGTRPFKAMRLLAGVQLLASLWLLQPASSQLDQQISAAPAAEAFNGRGNNLGRSRGASASPTSTRLTLALRE